MHSAVFIGENGQSLVESDSIYNIIFKKIIPEVLCERSREFYIMALLTIIFGLLLQVAETQLSWKGRQIQLSFFP